MSIKRNLNILFAAAVLLSGTGCMTTRSAQEFDEKVAAGWRPSKGYCTFGADTPALAAWCAEVNFGEEGLEVIARAVNERVLARAGGQTLPCTDHVAQVRQELAAYPDYTVTELYSCGSNPPVENGRAICHVSLMVASASGARIVLDNGHVLDPGTSGGVAPLQQFAQLVDHHWTGQTPAWVALASR